MNESLQRKYSNRAGHSEEMALCKRNGTQHLVLFSFYFCYWVLRLLFDRGDGNDVGGDDDGVIVMVLLLLMMFYDD